MYTPSCSGPIILSHPTLFTPTEIELFEDSLLANVNATEHDASRFFERFPQFLYFGHVADLRREVVMFPADGAPLQRVDFFRRTYGSLFWDILELKGPQKHFTVHAKSLHPRPSSDVICAITQAQDYRDLVITDDAVRSQLRRIGITVWRPQMIVIVGQTPRDLSPEAFAVLRDRLQNNQVAVLTYTDIFEFAREHCSRNKLLFLAPGYSVAAEQLTGTRFVEACTCLSDFHRKSVLHRMLLLTMNGRYTGLVQDIYTEQHLSMDLWKELLIDLAQTDMNVLAIEATLRQFFRSHTLCGPLARVGNSECLITIKCVNTLVCDIVRWLGLRRETAFRLIESVITSTSLHSLVRDLANAPLSHYLQWAVPGNLRFGPRSAILDQLQHEIGLQYNEAIAIEYVSESLAPRLPTICDYYAGSLQQSRPLIFARPTMPGPEVVHKPLKWNCVRAITRVNPREPVTETL